MSTNLNLGCGNKLIPSKRGHRWINLDMQIPTVTNAPSIIPKGTYAYTGNILKVGSLFPAKTFDSILAEFVFEHFTPAQILDLLYQLHQITKDKGFMTIRVPDFLGIVRNFNRSSAFDFVHVELVGLRIFCNERESPHKSIWTEASAEYYLQMDNLWKAQKVSHDKTGDCTMTFRMKKVLS